MNRDIEVSNIGRELGIKTMNKTLYDIEYITIDFNKLIENNLSVQLDIALFRDRILYHSKNQYNITIPYIKNTDYFFSYEFDNYAYNQCTVETLLIMGLLKRMSDRTKKLIDKAIKYNEISTDLQNNTQ